MKNHAIKQTRNDVKQHAFRRRRSTQHVNMDVRQKLVLQTVCAKKEKRFTR